MSCEDFDQADAKADQSLRKAHMQSCKRFIYIVFDLITASCASVFQNHWEKLWENMYPPILRVHLKKDKPRTYVMILVRLFVCFLLIFFVNAYAMGTHLNCMDKSMQFKRNTGCNL